MVKAQGADVTIFEIVDATSISLLGFLVWRLLRVERLVKNLPCIAPKGPINAQCSPETPQ